MSDWVFQRVEKVIRAIPGKSAVVVKPHMSLVSDLEIDSQAMVELILALEEEFGIRINDEEAEKVHTVQELLDFLLKVKD